MSKPKHKAARIAEAREALRQSGGMLAALRREEPPDLPFKPIATPGHPFGLSKPELEILLILSENPGLNSCQVWNRCRLRRRTGSIAVLLTRLWYQGMLKCRTAKGIKRWFLDTNGVDAVHLL